MRHNETTDLLHFIDASPTPYHAVAECAQRLRNVGFRELRETEAWTLKSGDACFVVRNEASIIAFRVPKKVSATTLAFNLVGAHTDSPCFKLKPNPQASSPGNWQQWGAETYGGLLLNSWLDRDLHLSGRICVMTKNGVESRLISLTKHRYRIPQLAIHLDRGVNDNGVKLNPQTQMTPVIGLSDGNAGNLMGEIAAAAKAKPEEIGAFDLYFHDAQPSEYGGLHDEFVYAPRLDNLASTHAGLSALIGAKPGKTVSLFASFDHEEVGSESQQGAASNMLPAVLERISLALGLGRDEQHAAAARSFMISSDMAHALHPNYAGQHEPDHKPLLNRGPALKSNAKMRYASDAPGIARFTALCRSAEVPLQTFVSRNDCPCGSTIGPICSTRLGIQAVDIGNPMLSMHSAREMAGSDDHPRLIKVFKLFFGE